MSKRSLDVEDAGLDIDVAVLERNPFARPQPALGQALLLPEPIERAFKRVAAACSDGKPPRCTRFDPRPPMRYR